MSGKIINTCQAKSSVLGAKGFYYPCDDQSGLFIRKGTTVEVLSYLSGRDNPDLQAISVANHLVEGSIVDEGNGVYWVDRKNVG